MTPSLLADRTFTPEARRLIDVHGELLERWRKAMNLVGPGPIDVHFDDAARALNGLTLTGRWADLGTGAGFPGLVLSALHPEVKIDLVDSRAKRTRFLEEVIGQAGWTQATVLCARHETLEPGVYDGIVSRALTAPEDMLDIARRLLVPGGRLVLFLQEDAPVPTAADVHMFHVEHYRVDGKPRKCATLVVGSVV